MGKKSKTKSKSAATPSASSGKSAPPQQKKSSDPPSSHRDDISIFQSHLDKAQLCAQFDSVIASSSPEEGIQAVRDLYLSVLKKKLTNEKRVQYLQDKQQSLQAGVTKYEALTEEENTGYLTAISQKDKLQTLSDRLNEKKEALLQENRMKAEAEKARQQQRTTDLISETQGISAKLEKYEKMRQEYAVENSSLKDKLRVVLDKYSSQEEEFNTALARQETEIAAASEKLTGASEILETEILSRDELEKKFAEELAVEQTLKEEVSEKATRFEVFQEALTTSNDTFKKFQARIEEQSKAIVALERENKQLSDKKDRTEIAIKEMSGEIMQSRRGVLETTQKQIAKLSGLCEALKLENEELTAKLEG